MYGTILYGVEDFIRSLLSTSDVFGTGWVAAVSASVKPGKTDVVVGDGAAGLLDVISAHQVAEGYRAMDERRAIKTRLHP